ncbi:MAG: protein kinase domain-containing protein [Aridibacter sp.]
MSENKNGVDVEILSEVRKLLIAETQDNFAEPIANINDLWQYEEVENFIGRRIGNYEITSEIGHGGMGIVFEVVRETEDFSQIFALKLLKRGMDSEALLKRFHSERQILASLEHPNIARLFDGGMTSENLPYFVLEFVEGQPLDEFCNRKNLGINGRLQLFLQICAAVSFAHSRLVVHRDLKPSNIFVTPDGTVKLLDFGIAKIISPVEKLQKQTVTSLRMMTPQYASPEQIKGEMVTTASDIYSLGLILYELLTGVSAYDFPSNRTDEIAKTICEEEPLRPSSVVNTESGFRSLKFRNKTSAYISQTTNSKAKSRNSKSLKGDLDNIILKALRKQPHRRYASVEQFATDISRHLEGLPVIARPDTFAYHAEKFFKRNRVSVVAGVLIFLTFVIGITATTIQSIRAERQKHPDDEMMHPLDVYLDPDITPDNDEFLKALACGANVNFYNKRTRTPFFSDFGDLKLEHLIGILEAGVKIDAKDTKGNTPLMQTLNRIIAGKYDLDDKMIRRLSLVVMYGADLNAKTADKPILARRYTNAFQRERLRTYENPLRPFWWLSSPKTQKLKNDPEFSPKPISNQNGVVEKYEEITKEEKDEDGEVTGNLYIEKITVKLDSGETKTIYLSDNSGTSVKTENDNIYPDIFGIAPANVSLPKGVSPTTVLGNLEGKKIILYSYPAFDFEEYKTLRYKVLFYD